LHAHSERELGCEGVQLRPRALGVLLGLGEVGAQMKDVLLRRLVSHLDGAGAAAGDQKQGEEEDHAPPPRGNIGGRQRDLTRKWARRFWAHHVSLCSVHSGRSSPSLMTVMRFAWLPCDTR